MNQMDLIGIHAKLRRAEQRIRELADGMDKLCEGIHKNIVREVREDVDKQTWVFQGPTPHTPVEWSVTIGEILYNLRSTLDHLVWQLVIDNGQTPGRHNEFPITEDDQRWQQEKVRALKGLSQRHQAMIGYLQPFTGGINLPFDVSMLRAIHELSNVEKHRHLILTVMASIGVHDGIFGIDPPELLDFRQRTPFKGSSVFGKVEEGKALLEFNNAHIEISSPSFDFALCFTGAEQHWTTARSVPDFLGECRRTVERTVELVTAPHAFGFVALGSDS